MRIRQADIMRSLRPTNICLSELGDTHGKYSCPQFIILDLTLLIVLSPGRFFVVDEIKALFAYIVATYDIKFEEGKGVPGGWCLAEVRWPGNTNLMFRARQK